MECFLVEIGDSELIMRRNGVEGDSVAAVGLLDDSQCSLLQ